MRPTSSFRSFVWIGGCGAGARRLRDGAAGNGRGHLAPGRGAEGRRAAHLHAGRLQALQLPEGRTRATKASTSI